MKKLLVILSIFIFSCSSDRSYEWDSGASRQDAFQQQKMEEQADETRNENTRPPGDYRGHPF